MDKIDEQKDAARFAFIKANKVVLGIRENGYWEAGATNGDGALVIRKTLAECIDRLIEKNNKFSEDRLKDSAHDMLKALRRAAFTIATGIDCEVTYKIISDAIEKATGSPIPDMSKIYDNQN